MTRCRLVTEQNGRRHISSVVLTRGEAELSLDLDAEMHERAGWEVLRVDDALVARRGPVERVIWIRESDPMADTT